MASNNKILIADDNQANCELLEAYLASVDCEVQVAVDGQDALDKVAQFEPDLILLDVMMPKLSGFEVCETLKENPTTRRIMVLMVTALNERGDIERAVQAGTDDFLSKPVNQVELIKRVENMLKLKDVTDEVNRLRCYIEEMEASAGPQQGALPAFKRLASSGEMANELAPMGICAVFWTLVSSWGFTEVNEWLVVLLYFVGEF